MSKILTLTLGFEEKFCYRAILRHGIKENDRIILITASLTDKVKRAYENIRSFINTSFGEKVKVDLLEIDVKNPIDSIKRLIDIFSKIKQEESEIIINLSGGMRILAIMVLFSLILTRIEKAKVEIELEDFSAVIDIPEQFINIFEISKKLTDERIKLMKEIKEGANDVKTLASKLKKDESTIRRNINILENLKLVEISKRKPLIFKLTNVGEVFVTIDKKHSKEE